MRINPPRIEIDPNEPFKGALFDRKAFGESLTALLKNTEESLVIFVNAPWGEGKTTFAKMWQAHLRKQNVEAIYFDAYASDYLEDPFVCFSGEILDFAGKHLGKPAKKEFRDTAITVGKRLAGLVMKIGLRTATMGGINATDVAELKNIGAEVAEGVGDVGADIIEKKIDGYTEEKDALKSFRESLAKLAKQVREKQGFPLTIIVDELDRCRPDFALNLLERIKHLFDVENVAFVLLVNRVQIENYVATIYGDGVDAHSYLLKFANLFVDLPVQQPVFRHEQGRQEFVRGLFIHHDFTERVPDSEFLSRSMSILIPHFDLTLREIEKVFVILCLYYGSLPKGQLSNEFLIATLALLKVRQPDLYGRLRRGLIDSVGFFRETGLDHFREESGNGITQVWVSDMINFCLMSDSNFAKACETTDQTLNMPRGPARMGSWLVRYGIDRNNVIPFFCSRLGQFTMSTG